MVGKKGGDKTGQGNIPFSKPLPPHIRIFRDRLNEFDQRTAGGGAGPPDDMLAGVKVDLEAAELEEKVAALKKAMGPSLVSELVAVCKKLKPPMDEEYLDAVLMDVVHETKLEHWPKARQAQSVLITDLISMIEAPEEKKGIDIHLDAALRRNTLRLTWGDEFAPDGKKPPRGGKSK